MAVWPLAASSPATQNRKSDISIQHASASQGADWSSMQESNLLKAARQEDLMHNVPIVALVAG
jgi:hypothetical protein